MQRVIRKVTVVLLVLALAFGNVFFVSAENPEEPTLIPIRDFFEEAGGSVLWDGDDRTITISIEDIVLILFVNNNAALRNGNVLVLQHEVIIRDSRAYIAAVDLQTLLTPGYLGTTIATAALAAEQFMEYVSIPGITVAIVDAKEGFTWTGGFGYADVAGGVPVDEYTLFGLASISKTFTASAVMQLVQAGIIDLDEPVVTYLPELSMHADLITGEGDYEKITARMLLAHASGIYTDFMGFGVATREDYYPAYMNDFLDNLANFPMSSPEATAFTYANNGTTLLGVLVAKMTGYDSYFEGFASYMLKNVLEPAGMDLTTFILEDRHMPHLAKPYVDAATPDEFVFFNALSAGGIFSNANDMARFMHILLSGGAYDGGSRILTADSVRQMFEMQDFGFEEVLSIIRPGMGTLHSEGMDGFKYVGHGGNLVHYHSSMIFDVESGLGVFVSVNSISGMAIVEALSVMILQTAVTEKTGSLNLPPSDPDVVPIEITEEQLKALEGIYIILGADRLSNIVYRDGVLYFENLASVPMPLDLIPLSDGSFINPATELRFWFEEVEGELVLFLGEFKSQPAGGRLEPELFEEIASEEDIRHLIGTYLPVLEEGHISIVSSVTVGVDENGFGYALLAAMHGHNGFSLLIPIGENSFMGGLEFTVDGSDVWLEFSGLRMVRTSGN